MHNMEHPWVNGADLVQGTLFSYSTSGLWRATGCTHIGHTAARESSRSQVSKHKPLKSYGRKTSFGNSEKWSSKGFPGDQRKDGDILPLARGQVAVPGIPSTGTPLRLLASIAGWGLIT